MSAISVFLPVRLLRTHLQQKVTPGKRGSDGVACDVERCESKVGLYECGVVGIKIEVEWSKCGLLGCRWIIRRRKLHSFVYLKILVVM